MTLLPIQQQLLQAHQNQHKSLWTSGPQHDPPAHATAAPAGTTTSPQDGEATQEQKSLRRSNCRINQKMISAVALKGWTFCWAYSARLAMVLAGCCPCQETISDLLSGECAALCIHSSLAGGMMVPATTNLGKAVPLFPWSPSTTACPH